MARLHNTFPVTTNLASKGSRGHSEEGPQRHSYRSPTPGLPQDFLVPLELLPSLTWRCHSRFCSFCFLGWKGGPKWKRRCVGKWSSLMLSNSALFQSSCSIQGQSWEGQCPGTHQKRPFWKQPCLHGLLGVALQSAPGHSQQVALRPPLGVTKQAPKADPPLLRVALWSHARSLRTPNQCQVAGVVAHPPPVLGAFAPLAPPPDLPLVPSLLPFPTQGASGMEAGTPQLSAPSADPIQLLFQLSTNLLG